MVDIYHWINEDRAPFDALAHILDYLWDRELCDFKNTEAKGHVFEQLAAVANWLNGGADWSPLNYVEARRSHGYGWRASATHQAPGVRTVPEPGTFPEMRKAFLEGRTLDVSEAASLAGLPCPVSVTVNVWKALVEDDSGDRPDDEAESLAFLLERVAEAYTREGKDIFTWLYAIGRDGLPVLTPIKGVHDLGEAGPSHLTVMMAWEDESFIKKAAGSGTSRAISGPDEG